MLWKFVYLNNFLFQFFFVFLLSRFGFSSNNLPTVTTQPPLTLIVPAKQVKIAQAHPYAILFLSLFIQQQQQPITSTTCVALSPQQEQQQVSKEIRVDVFTCVCLFTTDSIFFLTKTNHTTHSSFFFLVSFHFWCYKTFFSVCVCVFVSVVARLVIFVETRSWYLQGELLLLLFLRKRARAACFESCTRNCVWKMVGWLYWFARKFL